MSASYLTSIANFASDVVSFIYVILWCVFLSWIFACRDFYHCFRLIIQSPSRLFLHLLKSRPEQKRVADNSPPSLSTEDIEAVLENMGLNPGHQMPRQGSYVEVASVFDRVGPCSNEVKEAFSMFDKNNDGFIDANDLERVLNSMGLMGFAKEEYQRMIMVFDDDGDGKIDFGEFVKVVEDCSF